MNEINKIKKVNKVNFFILDKINFECKGIFDTEEEAIEHVQYIENIVAGLRMIILKIPNDKKAKKLLWRINKLRIAEKKYKVQTKFL